MFQQSVNTFDKIENNTENVKVWVFVVVAIYEKPENKFRHYIVRMEI